MQLKENREDGSRRIFGASEKERTKKDKGRPRNPREDARWPQSRDCSGHRAQARVPLKGGEFFYLLNSYC